MTKFQVNFYNPFSADPRTMQTETIIAESEAVVRDVYSDVDVISIATSEEAMFNAFYPPAPLTPAAEYQPRQTAQEIALDENGNLRPYSSFPRTSGAIADDHEIHSYTVDGE